jgi:hypothetical protein
MHPVYVHNGFLILAIIFFLLGGFRYTFREPRRTPGWTDLGFASVVAAFVFPFFV